MTTLSDDRPALSADQLRAALTDQLCDQGVVRTPRIETAFRDVARDLFVPDVPLEEAYADNAVYTKSDAVGTSISAASQPRIVAMMLEQLDAQPGHKVLEAGAGTGYNAALMAAIVGDTGHVTTIDVDQDLVDGARANLASAGINNVDVILGDGALGYADTAPYDRVIATVSAFEPLSAWLRQLAPHGRLVMPLRLRGAASRSIIFERDGDAWRSRGSEMAVFMPLRRGIGDDTRRTVTLTPEQDVTMETHQDQTVDATALTSVLDTPRHEAWTDVHFAPMISFEWLDLWLACTLDNALMRMSVEESAKDRGQVTPMFGWGSMTTTRNHDLAYLTLRPAPPVDGEKRYEVGVIGHGPTSSALAQEMAEQVRTWDAHYRTRTVRFEIPDAPATLDSAAGRFVLDRPHHPITVIWE
ncbi:MAG: L-isoaspartate O-methyltransferase [Actinoallomurus sp.]|nr:L-isoaspartate O-methyltransferase [Actinoallomurus sp.]